MFEANLFCTDYFNWETNRASRADAPTVLRVRRSSLNDILAPESGWKEHFRADAPQQARTRWKSSRAGWMAIILANDIAKISDEIRSKTWHDDETLCIFLNGIGVTFGK